MLNYVKIAAGVSVVYLLSVIAAFAIMAITSDDTPMAGIFLVLVTPPWSFILAKLSDGSGYSDLFNGLLLLAGGMVNGVVLFIVILCIAHLFGKRG